MEINIRRATMHDYSLLSKLSTVTFLDTFRGTCTDEDIKEFVTTFFNEEQVYKELQDAEDFYFIAFINNIAIGYLRMKEENSVVPVINIYKAIELKRIYVVKEYLNQKVGAALMKFALQFAEDHQYQAIYLGVWEHNERAKAFYTKWGFTDTGHMHDFPIGKTAQIDRWLIKVL